MSQNELQSMLATNLRLICRHDSRSVDGCVTCEAADYIEAAQAVAPGGLPKRRRGDEHTDRFDDGWNACLDAMLAAAPASEAKGQEVIEMRLCEAPHLILKRDQLYRFTVDPNCAQCREAAMAYEPAASSAVGEYRKGYEKGARDVLARRRDSTDTIMAEQEQAGECPERLAEWVESAHEAFAMPDEELKGKLQQAAALLRRAARVEVTDAMVDRVAAVLIPPGATRIRICEAYNLARRVIAAALEPKE